MRPLIVFCWIALLTSLAGCLPTLEPVYTESQLVFDDELVGVWTQSGSNNKWQVERGEKKSYRIAYLENGNRTAQFVGHVCQLGDLLVLDLFPEEDENKTNGMVRFHQVPLHTAYVVAKSPKKLEVAAVDFKWLEEYMQEHPSELASTKPSGRLVVTASTGDLQKFIAAHRDKFTNRLVLER